MSTGWWGRLFKNKATKAEQAVSAAIEQVAATEVQLQGELDALHSEHQAQRTLLQRLVQARALKSEIMSQTQKVKLIGKQLVQKKKLLGNMHRERQQLDAVTTNTGVAVAMKASVDAQKKLLTMTTQGEGIDDLLDDVDEYRQETSDVAERLGAMGVADQCDLEEDETTFSSTEILEAMGWQPLGSDDLLVDEMHAFAGQTGPAVCPTTFAPITINAQGQLRVNPIEQSFENANHLQFPNAPAANRTSSQTQPIRGLPAKPWSF